jgi:hypothetical protein
MMTTLSTLLEALLAHPDHALSVQLPDRSTIPPHFHVTEVGRVRKDFIDCGGTVRSVERCVLQVWVADDRDHRVTAGKLAKIIRAGMAILGDADLEVEVEYDVGVITQLPVVAIETTTGGAELRIQLGGKHTACLASDRCGVPDSTGSACAAPGCCAPSAATTPAAAATTPLTIGLRR